MDLLQQTDLKQLNLNGRYKCSKSKGHFLGHSVYLYIYINMYKEIIFIGF